MDAAGNCMAGDGPNNVPGDPRLRCLAIRSGVGVLDLDFDPISPLHHRRPFKVVFPGVVAPHGVGLTIDIRDAEAEDRRFSTSRSRSSKGDPVPNQCISAGDARRQRRGTGSKGART